MADPLLETLRKSAEWDATFQGSSLAKRRRAAESRMDYEDELVAQEEENLMRRAQTDKTAQDYLFKRESLRQKQRQHGEQMNLRERQFQSQQELREMQIQSQKAHIAATTALEKARLNKEARDARNAERLANDTDAFENGIQEMLEKDNLFPGSQEFANRLIGLTAKHPFVDPKLRAQYFKEAKIVQDADAVMSDVARLKAEGMTNLTVTGDANGYRVTARIPTGGNADTKRLQYLEGLRSRVKTDEKGQVIDKDVADYLDRDIAELRQKTGKQNTNLQESAVPRGTNVPQNDAAPDVSQQPQPAEEMVSVIRPDGKRGRIPLAQKDAALKAGYKLP